MVIDVTRDREGLEQAILGLLEEGFAFSRVRSSLCDAAEDTFDRLMNSIPPRTLSPGYYKLGEYLLWLESILRASVSPKDFASFEAEGLVLISRARRTFESNHPACGACGAHQDSAFATQCHNCGVEFGKKKN